MQGWNKGVTTHCRTSVVSWYGSTREILYVPCFSTRVLATPSLQYPSCTTMVRQGKSWLKRQKKIVCKKTYIGETGRMVRLRYNEHLRDAKNHRRDSSWGEHFLNEHQNYQPDPISASQSKSCRCVTTSVTVK